MASNRRVKIIVSGMPRSGTSMMMRCLEHAGIPACHDPDMLREKHKFNVNGFYESTVPLGNLPPGWCKKVFNPAKLIQFPWVYHVVYMRRNPDVRQDSLMKLLGNRGRCMGYENDMLQHEMNLSVMTRNYNVTELVQINYEDVLRDPLKEMLKLKHWGIDPFKLAELVEIK